MPLSELGHRQADALGHWFAALPEDERPEVVLVSPYVRAQPDRRRRSATAGGVTAGAKGPVKSTRGCASASSACGTG